MFYVIYRVILVYYLLYIFICYTYIFCSFCILKTASGGDLCFDVSLLFLLFEKVNSLKTKS